MSQDSPPDSTNSTAVMHPFINPNSIPDPTHFPCPQRLSLSLGSGPCSHIRHFDPTHSNPGGYLHPDPDDVMMPGDHPFSGYNNNPFAPLINPCNINNNHHHQPQPQPCSASCGAESFAGVGGSSRYLKSAQSLLLEMVSVGGEELDASNRKYAEKMYRAGRRRCFGLPPELKSEFSDSEACVSSLRLLALLEEVERRYGEYYDHMDGLVTSFGMIAGLGSGRSYTGPALQAMSKHFWTLRKAILSQIRAAKLKTDMEGPKIGSGLSLLDLEGCQNRAAAQHIGLMHNARQAWRPIRGLPETSVTILRAWLFEHFLHPYPNESEKLMLASQTGLSKNQVSNWFINARVRLWKPMIEEMYKEEFADQTSTESEQLPMSTEGVEDSADQLF